MIPQLNTIWRYTGPGWGHGDKQRVIYADQAEVVTISERNAPEDLDWSGLWGTADFPKNFQLLNAES